MEQRLTAVLPCNDLDAAQRFFERLGFAVTPSRTPSVDWLPRREE